MKIYIHRYYTLIISVLLFDVGQCLTYSIVLGSSAHQVFTQIMNNENENSVFLNKSILLIFCYIFFLFPFSLGKDFRFIERISAFAIFSIVFSFGTLSEHDLTIMEPDKNKPVINVMIVVIIQTFVNAY